MCVCYLSQGAYSGAFHDAAQEEQVDVLRARGGGKVTHIIYHLLHGWMDEARRETKMQTQTKRRRKIRRVIWA